MKITFEEITRRDSWTGWAILHSMIGKEDELFNQVRPVNEEKSFDVVMTINGIEVDFSTVMSRMQEQYEHCVGNKAKEIVQETFGDMLGNLSTLINDAKRECVSEIHKKFPGMNCDDEY
jgi:DNA polymerase elongation subunit (family B)